MAGHPVGGYTTINQATPGNAAVVTVPNACWSAQLDFVVVYSDAGALVKPLTDPPS